MHWSIRGSAQYESKISLVAWKSLRLLRAFKKPIEDKKIVFHINNNTSIHISVFKLNYTDLLLFLFLVIYKRNRRMAYIKQPDDTVSTTFLISHIRRSKKLLMKCSLLELECVFFITFINECFFRASLKKKLEVVNLAEMILQDIEKSFSRQGIGQNDFSNILNT